MRRVRRVRQGLGSTSSREPTRVQQLGALAAACAAAAVAAALVSTAAAAGAAAAMRCRRQQRLAAAAAAAAPAAAVGCSRERTRVQQLGALAAACAAAAAAAALVSTGVGAKAAAVMRCRRLAVRGAAAHTQEHAWCMCRRESVAPDAGAAAPRDLAASRRRHLHWYTGGGHSARARRMHCTFGFRLHPMRALTLRPHRE